MGEFFDRCRQWLRALQRRARGLPTCEKILALNGGLTVIAVTAIALASRLPGPQALRSVLLHLLLQGGSVTLLFAAAQQRRPLPPLEDYLKAVRAFLPRRQRDDILRELSANLQAAMEDRAARLGRPLSEAEQVAFVQSLGSPLLVASRYRQEERRVTFGRPLIGPALFPLYRQLLAFNGGLVITLLGLLPLAGGKPFGPVVSRVLLHLGLQFGLVTLVFAVLDRFQDPLFGWHPPGPRSPSPPEA
jgi:hypothetical protein